MKHTIMEAVMIAAGDPTSFPQIEPDVVAEAKMRVRRERTTIDMATAFLPDDPCDDEVIKSRWGK